MVVPFDGKILIIGYGSVAQCTLPLLERHVKYDPRKLTVMDFADKRAALSEWREKGVRYAKEKVTRENLDTLLTRHAGSNSLVIDLAWYIGANDIIQWCHDHNALYINTSVELWTPDKDFNFSPSPNKTLYVRQMALRKMVSKWREDGVSATTSIVDRGANPGLISDFTKQGGLDLAKLALRKKGGYSREEKRLIEQYASEQDFPRLFMTLGVKVIHCSERDSQVTNVPKRVGEAVGTWSLDGLDEEGRATAEMGWGTHEPELPKLGRRHMTGPMNQIYLERMGINTEVYSWVPTRNGAGCQIKGMVIRHGEAFGISDRLTVRNERGRVVYRPTVHYAYMPCDATLETLWEYAGRGYKLQEKLRIMNDEITEGDDTLGALLMGHKFNSYWTGSMLSIEESRRIVQHQNATTLQVAAGVLSGIEWMVRNPKRGFILPDDLPHEETLKTAMPYLGDFVSVQSDWTPLSNRPVFFDVPDNRPDPKHPWAFGNFLVPK